MLYIAAVIIVVALLVAIFFPRKKNIDPLPANEGLLSSEELYKHAMSIAQEHNVTRDKKHNTLLLYRVKNNFSEITEVYKFLNKKSKDDIPLCPASEWLLDNYYFIEEQINFIFLSANKRLLRNLYMLEDMYLKGYPRIFVLAYELVSHTDGKIDKGNIITFVKAYQTKKILSIGELWSLSVMLQIALIEKVTNVCRRIRDTQLQWDKVQNLSDKNTDEIMNIVKNSFSDSHSINYEFAEPLLKYIRNLDQNNEELIEYINKKLNEFNTSSEAIRNYEHQEQASLQISIGNSITSLKLIASLDFEEIFEELSFVEKILLEDPSGCYSSQDFESRDYYRHKIENLSNDIDVPETIIAKKVVECAINHSSEDADSPECHVGYYIIGKGQKLLIKELGKNARPSAPKPLGTYTLPIIVISLAASVSLALYVFGVTADNRILFSFIIFLIALIPSSEIAVNITNWIITHLYEPDFIPKLDFKDKIPDRYRTVIIVPTILSSSKRVRELIDNLEVTYISNNESNLYFALIGDFKDSHEEHLKDEKAILEMALKSIQELNNKYKDNKFYFLCRKRIFNKQQNKWMGWERKRGAIIEFCSLLRGSSNTTFTNVSGDMEPLKTTKYIITLDADTILPAGTARRLIGGISHPLNRAVYDKEKGRVVEGYGILQPQIGINIESSNKSLFTRIFAGNGGIDNYAAAVSDVYQDLFREGIFTGKGIVDIDIFIEALSKSIPENTLLSHDLIEGSYVRTGLVTDIELIDGFPEKYNSYMMRLHRWVRGDWQIIKWLFPYIRNENGMLIKNPINKISRWKILDNIRRSLFPVFLFLQIVFGTLFLPLNPLVWIGLSIICIFTPIFINFLNYIILKHYKTTFKKFSGNIIYGFKAVFYQSLLGFIFLPHNCFSILDAIVKTLYRVFISKRNLLEWVTAAEVEKNLKNDLTSYFKRMSNTLAAVLAFTLLCIIFVPYKALTLSPFLLVWLFSPLAAHHISKIKSNRMQYLTDEENDYLRKIARETWAFYEDFANSENNYLPIDNFQELPVEKAANRTSPTNIGFYLISLLSAGDFGYITTSKLLEKLDQTISTIEKMEKWHGHLYNWYDTKTLDILLPKYISTVDSGNFVGYLITLNQGLKEFLNKDVIDLKLLSGLKDTLMLEDFNDNSSLNKINSLLKNEAPVPDEFLDAAEHVENLCRNNSKTRAGVYAGEIKDEIYKFYPHTLLNNICASIEALPEDISNLLENIKQTTSISELKMLYEKILSSIEGIKQTGVYTENKGMSILSNDLMQAVNNINNLINLILSLEKRIENLINDTMFLPLYDKKRHLFSIGYDVDNDRLTNSYYDLLASEARITSYISIARREVPTAHWFHLSRTLVEINKYKSLVSWTGTMFEYFMPPLIMKDFDNTLLNETYQTVVMAQIKYGKDRGLPWGTSESGYYAFDFLLNYQYKAFGVPDLGLKRGLVKDMVVSPYSTLLTLPFKPREAVSNLYYLLKYNIEGKYGLFEAVDFTPERVPKEQKYSVIQSYMAHHQGMILTALNNFMNSNIMVKRFHSCPVIRSGEFLLQERIPVRAVITKEIKEEVRPFSYKEKEQINFIRKFNLPSSSFPQCHLLSNGDYSIMVTDFGYSYSKYRDIQISRWREDLSLKNWGIFVFFRETRSGKYWSSALEPACIIPDNYEVTFSQDKASYKRTDGNIETYTEVCVTPEDNCEIRRITLYNHSSEEVIMECTSYLEPVLSPYMADVAHPAFNNLFIRTEAVTQYQSVIASRRPRSENADILWAFHTLAFEGDNYSNLEFETDRYKFIGRGHSIENPLSIDRPLSNTSGAVLDPVFSLRKRFKIMPGKSVVLSFTTGVAESKDAAIELCKKYCEILNAARGFDLAYLKSQMEAGYMNLKESDIINFDGMIPYILFANPLKKKFERYLSENTKGQPGLWAYGISGDLPIVLVTISKAEYADVVKAMIKAHEYWHTKGLKVDLVILNKDESSYFQPLFNLLKELAYASHGRNYIDTPGGIFVRNSASMPPEDKILIHEAAALIIDADYGNIKNQITLKKENKNQHKNMIFSKAPSYFPDNDPPLELLYFNGYGGFNIKSREYVIRLKDGTFTPSPWINVIANKDFGFIITENGSGFTWSENSRENKLTPWSNDPVSDTPGEVIYLRDDETGEFWTVTPLPVREKQSYTITHGIGYSKFLHSSHGINQELLVFVPKEDSVKLSILKFKNLSGKKRKLSIFYYIRPLLGVSDQITQHHIVTQWNDSENLLLIKNTFNSDFPGRTAFIGSSHKILSFTGDRTEFIGNCGSLNNPCGLKLQTLSEGVGYGLDPCAVIQNAIEIEGDGEKELVLMLGQTRNSQEISDLVSRYSTIENCIASFEETSELWRDRIEKIVVSTPDDTFNLLMNSWLLYQTLSCRIWARSAFYQSGGAYGFRDQLQDVLSFINILPEIAKDQILLHCAHQFVEGDVQHWWHPGAGEKGIRTRFSDDLLWLPFVAAEYVEKTGDTNILKIEKPYLEQSPLKENEDEQYNTPGVSEQKSSVYEHCVRAVERALQFGPHGIPLMGSGDWNDGMNTVGNKGRGESIWLGWFLYDTLIKFIPLCSIMEDHERAKKYSNIAKTITEAIEENGWDGEWYLRAYFDDGSPLGSSVNSECKIDSIAQSWSVISEGGIKERSERAMKAVDDYLVMWDEGLIKLFTPPFDNGDLKPGYIKGYVPGVRENGGQYTHAATWVIYAYSKMGLGDKAYKLFSLINPINHTMTELDCAKYKVEPYVMAADVYAVEPHTGRGGWTWYTGSSGWMYKVGLEEILGFKLKGSSLVINPCIPSKWKEFSIKYKYNQSLYNIQVKNPLGINVGVKRVSSDGLPCKDGIIHLEDDGKEHFVEIVLGN